MLNEYMPKIYYALCSNFDLLNGAKRGRLTEEIYV